MKQNVILNQGSGIIVQNQELVYDVSGGLKIGDLPSTSFKTYPELPELLGYANEDNGEDSLHLRLINAGLKKGNTLKHPDIIYEYEGERPRNVWIGQKISGDWIYQIDFETGVQIEIIKLVKYWGGVNGEEQKATIQFTQEKTDSDGIDTLFKTPPSRLVQNLDDDWSETVYYGLDGVGE